MEISRQWTLLNSSTKMYVHNWSYNPLIVDAPNTWRRGY